jgi:hypothetical protein
MKQTSLFLITLALCATPKLMGQDAATEERLNKLSGQIENLMERQNAQHKQMEALSKEVEAVREAASRPNGSYASQQDLKRLMDSVKAAIKEVDGKRMEDIEKVHKELMDLAKLLKSTPGSGSVAAHSRTEKSTGSDNPGDKPPKDSHAGSSTGAKDEKGFPYEIKSGDTLSLIVQAYREKNIKVTVDSILKANPGLKAESLQPKQKIWIPAPQS